MRKVIVFELRQVSGTSAGPVRARLDRLGNELVKEISIEQAITERTLIGGDREPYEAVRREQQLVVQLAAHLERIGHDVCRLQFRPEGEPAALFCDLFDSTTRTIYEAKGTVTREAMRNAIGQLADYSRFVTPPPRRSILMPEQPRADLLALAESQAVAVVWPVGERFGDRANGGGG